MLEVAGEDAGGEDADTLYLDGARDNLCLYY